MQVNSPKQKMKRHNQFGKEVFPIDQLDKIKQYFKLVGFEEPNIVELYQTETGWGFQHKNGMCGTLTNEEIEHKVIDV